MHCAWQGIAWKLFHLSLACSVFNTRALQMPDVCKTYCDPRLPSTVSAAPLLSPFLLQAIASGCPVHP